MVLKAYCSKCGRTVYLDEEATPACPVCSNPLLDSEKIGLEVTEDTTETPA